MSATTDAATLRHDLIEDGFCVIPNMADGALLNKTRACVRTRRWLNTMLNGERTPRRPAASSIPISTPNWPT